MAESVTLVSGALKNIGDFLITEKAREFIEKIMKPKLVKMIKRTDDFKPHLKEINQTDAIIICGGPGYQEHFFPRVYPFLRYIKKLRPPIVPFALGWRGTPLYRPAQFQFSPLSLKYIFWLHKRIPISSTRDEITRKILQRVGITNVINTGCPTLFDADFIEQRKQFRKPKEIIKIAVSMAQNWQLHQQNIELVKKLKMQFPNAQILAMFHRGTGPDKYTSEEEGMRLQRLVRKTRKLGLEIVDLAYSLDRIRLYKKVDFHIGYRVHAHAFMICNRIPSFLLWEDGRGQGMSLNLGLPGIPALRYRISDRFILPSRLNRYFNWAERKIIDSLIQPVNTNAVNQMMKFVTEQIENGLTIFDSIPERLAELNETMIKFLQEIDMFVEK